MILSDKFPEFESKDENLIIWLNDCLIKAPTYFWIVPASTSGKYHQGSSHDTLEGGNVLHTRRVLVVARELREVFLLSDKEFGLVQASIVLHDTFRCGFEGRENKSKDGVLHTEILHSIYLRVGFAKVVVPDSISDAEVDLVFELIEGHYGKWSPIPQCYPTDFSNLDRREQLKVFVHLCDMVASRGSIDVKL